VTALKTKEIEGILIVGFSSGKLLDDLTIQQVGNELIETASNAQEGQKILLTFHGVSFMSSAMLGKLVLFLKKCKQQGVELKVCSILPEIYEVFKLTKLNKTFDIQKDEEMALASFNKKGWFS
jgi:anti-sigma B factor antagonist